MRKTLIATMVGVGFAGAATAQTSNVTLYGRANLGIDSYRGAGATNANQSYKSRTRVFDSASRIGIRGSEDLGNGLRAVFQVETGVNIDSGSQSSQSTATNGSSGFLGSRPSFAGLEGGFGRLLFGRQDVYWGNGTISQSAANYVNTEVPFFTGGNTGLVNMGVSRQSNVASWTTPQLGPLNMTFYWSPDTNAAGGTGNTPFANNENTGPGLNTNARLLAGTARYAMGPLAAQVDYARKETRSDFGSTNGSVPRNTGIKAAVGWSYLPGAQISLLAMRVKTDNALLPGASAVDSQSDLQQTSWGINWEHILGNVQFLAQYGQSGKVSGCSSTATVVNGTSTSSWCDNSQTRGWMVGARYLMSKRTSVYATYNELRNQANAFSDYNGASMTSVAGASAYQARGFDPRIVAVGVQHNF